MRSPDRAGETYTLGGEPLKIQVLTPGNAPTYVGEEAAAEAPVLRLGELFGVLRRHLWLIALLGIVSSALTYWVLSRERPAYQATALIRLLDASQSVTQGVVDAQPRAALGRSDPIASEIVVLSGRAVAGAVVDSLSLRLFDAAEQAPPRWVTAARVTLPADKSLTLPVKFSARSVTVDTGRSALTVSYGDTVRLSTVRFVVPRKPSVERADLSIVTRDVAIDVVRAGLSPRVRDGTSAIDVTYTSTRRQLAVNIVNRTITEYKAMTAAAERQQERQRADFLAQQLAESEEALRSAQSALANFRSEQQVHRSTERFAAEQQTLAQIEMRTREHDSDQRTYQALLAEMDKSDGSATALRSLAADSNVAASPVVNRLYGELTALEGTRDSLVATGKLPTYPLVKQVEERITGAEGRLREAVRTQVAVLQGRVGELQEMHTNSAAKMEMLSQAEAEEARLEQRATSVQQLWERLREQHQLARMALAVDVGKVQIIDVATRAIRSTGSRLPKLMLGVAAGLLLGIGLAFLRERMNTSIRRRGDIERVLRVPGLAVIPQMRVRRRWRMPLLGGANGNGNGAHAGSNGAHAHRNGSAKSQSIIDNVTKGSSQAEVFRSLRTRLLLSHGSRALRVLVVTSAHGEDGKTTTASNLAVAFAQQGFRVGLVDGDLRRPAIHTLFDVPSKPGLADALMESVIVDEAVHMTAISRLYVVPAGDTRMDAPDQLKGDRLTRVFSSLAKRFDLVLVDSPPLQAVPDAAILAAHADGVILVLRAGHTGREVAQQAVDQLVDVGATVVGAVLNDPDSQASKYPDYSSRYSYGYTT